MTPQAGNRIRVVALIDDPNPLEVGTEGTVERVGNPGSRFEQVWVRWDNGRTLMLVPEDYRCVRVLS